MGRHCDKKRRLNSSDARNDKCRSRGMRRKGLAESRQYQQMLERDSILRVEKGRGRKTYHGMKVEGFYNPPRRVFHPAEDFSTTTTGTKDDEEKGVNVMGRFIIGSRTITAALLPYPLNPLPSSPSSSLQAQPPNSAPPSISGRQFAPRPELTPL